MIGGGGWSQAVEVAGSDYVRFFGATHAHLLGDLRGPTLPPSWAELLDWPAAFTSSVSGRRIVLSRDSVLKSKGVNAATLPTELPEIATVAVNSLRQRRGWASVMIGDVGGRHEHSGMVIGDVPLHRSTLALLHTLDINLDSPLEEVFSLTRNNLCDEADGPLALLDLEMALECWLPHYRSDDVTTDILEATTLTQLAMAYARRVIEQEVGGTLEPVDLVRRHGWGCKGATLEAIGLERDLTRERVRQLLKVADARLGIRRWPLPPSLAPFLDPSVTHRELSTADEEEVDAWSIPSIVDLLECTGHVELAAEVLERDARENPDLEAGQRAAIRSARSLLGFIDLCTLVEDPRMPSDPDIAQRLVEQVYPRTFRTGDFMLAGSSERTTTESICGQLFTLAPSISVAELIEGLDRVARKRGAAAPPPGQVLVRLLERAGAVLVDGDRLAGPQIELATGTLQSWLVETLDSAPGDVMHSHDILRTAMRDGVNIASLGSHLTYDPLVRRVPGRAGLVRLAGRSPSDQELDAAERIADAQRVPVSVSLEYLEGGAVEIAVIVGSAFLLNGVLPVTQELAAVWPSRGVVSDCHCGLVFGGERRIADKERLLSGWMTMLTHAIAEHDLREGSVIRLRLVGRNITAVSYA
jgi:hypothetical protein